MVITLKQFVKILLNTQDSGRMLHSLLKPKWKTKIFFFIINTFFFMELQFHFHCTFQTLPLFDYGDTVYTDALESITEHCLSAAMVSHSPLQKNAALSCVWLFVCFCSFVCFFRDCQMLINTKNYFWITYSFARALIPQCHLQLLQFKSSGFNVISTICSGTLHSEARQRFSKTMLLHLTDTQQRTT